MHVAYGATFYYLEELLPDGMVLTSSDDQLLNVTIVI